MKSKQNSVNVEMYGRYSRSTPDTRIYPKIFMDYAGRKRHEVMFALAEPGYTNTAVGLIISSPENPNFNLNFTSGPKEEQLETLLKKGETLFTYSGELQIELQEWFTRYLTDRRFINKIKRYQAEIEKTSTKIDRIKKRFDAIMDPLEGQCEKITNKIWFSKKQVGKLEAELFKKIK